MTEQELKQENHAKSERFCSWCGLSLVPLSNDINCYVSKKCTDCSKTIYVLPSPAKNGQGLVINPGESHHILIEPFSLDPNQRGFFTRDGLLLTARMLLAAEEPKSEAELETLLKLYKDKAKNFLRDNSSLGGLDWDNENHINEICDRLTQDRDKREFFALKMLFLSQTVEQAIAENNARQAAWATYHATMAHCFFEMRDFDFEETLWQGHQARVFLAKVQDVSTQNPAQVQAIQKLQPLFERQSEVTLHTWVTDEKPIGERIGVTGLPEETLKSMAQHYLNQFERNRQDASQAKEDRRQEEEARRQEKIRWNPILIALISSITAVIISLVNKFIPPH